MKDATVIKKNKDIVARIVDDELVLVPLYKTDKDINCIYTLNESAAAIWEAIDDESTLADIKNKLGKKFFALDGDGSIDEFLKDLKEIKAVE